MSARSGATPARPGGTVIGWARLAPPSASAFGGWISPSASVGSPYCNSVRSRSPRFDGVVDGTSSRTPSTDRRRQRPSRSRRLRSRHSRTTTGQPRRPRSGDPTPERAPSTPPRTRPRHPVAHCPSGHKHGGLIQHHSSVTLSSPVYRLNGPRHPRSHARFVRGLPTTSERSSEGAVSLQQISRGVVIRPRFVQNCRSLH